MEDDPIQAYNRRMRRFNFAVVVAALLSLAVLIIISSKGRPHERERGI